MVEAFEIRVSFCQHTLWFTYSPSIALHAAKKAWCFTVSKQSVNLLTVLNCRDAQAGLHRLCPATPLLKFSSTLMWQAVGFWLGATGRSLWHVYVWFECTHMLKGSFASRLCVGAFFCKSLWLNMLFWSGAALRSSHFCAFGGTEGHIWFHIGYFNGAETGLSEYIALFNAYVYHAGSN